MTNTNDSLEEVVETDDPTNPTLLGVPVPLDVTLTALGELKSAWMECLLGIRDAIREKLKSPEGTPAEEGEAAQV